MFTFALIQRFERFVDFGFFYILDVVECSTLRDSDLTFRTYSKSVVYVFQLVSFFVKFLSQSGFFFSLSAHILAYVFLIRNNFRGNWFTRYKRTEIRTCV